jgi:hypothetical protein
MAKKTSGVKMGPKIPGVIKDPVKVKPIPMSVLKKIMGTDVPLAIKKKDGGLIDAIKKVKAKEMKAGGEAVPAKFKGFSKLPEAVQQKMDPSLAERFEDGGPVKMGSGGGVCKGMGMARAGGKVKVR